MNKAKLKEAALLSAEAGLSLQRGDGSFPPGRNGPHDDPETPARNTANWSVLLAWAYGETGKSDFREAALSAARFLTGAPLRPHGVTFHCRLTRDRCNGLIGQFWVIDALVILARMFRAPDWEVYARDCFLRHPFDHERGGWMSVDIDGRVLGMHIAVNQQIWFAVAGAKLHERSDGKDRERLGLMLDAFFDSLPKLVTLHWNGLIFHHATRSVLDYLRRWFLGLGRGYHALETAYHPFCLLGLAVLAQTEIAKNRMPELPRWRRAFSLLARKDYLKRLRSDPFAFGYNPVGFHVPRIMETFADRFEASELPCAERYLNIQMERHFDWHGGTLSRGSSDPLTLSSRMREALYLLGPAEFRIGSA